MWGTARHLAINQHSLASRLPWPDCPSHDAFTAIDRLDGAAAPGDSPLIQTTAHTPQATHVTSELCENQMLHAKFCLQFTSAPLPLLLVAPLCADFLFNAFQLGAAVVEVHVHLPFLDLAIATLPANQLRCE